MKSKKKDAELCVLQCVAPFGATHFLFVKEEAMGDYIGTKAMAEMAVEEFNSSDDAEGTISDKTDHSDKIEKKEKGGFFSIFRHKK